MNPLDDLYQEILLDHYKRPHNFGGLDDADVEAEGHNPLCGDRVHVRVKLAGERLSAVRFEGSGCAISTAAASMMTEAVNGMTREQVDELFGRYRAHVTGEGAPPVADDLGELAALGGVREFPMRVKCATLAWHALKAALDSSGATVTTERPEPS